MKNYDLLIVGGGPVGLYAAFYAGMRGLTVAIVEAFDEVGGQPQNLYPEKKIYDIAGLPEIPGAALTKNLLRQLEGVEYDSFVGQYVQKIEQNGELFSVITDENEYSSKSVLLTTGAGLISPRKLNLEGEEERHQTGKLSYFIRSLEDFRDQKVAVLGGGDSALDWSLMLEGIASEVHLIHRRPKFRAHQLTVEEVKNSTIQIHTPYVVSALTESGLDLQVVKSDEKLRMDVDRILVNYGFLTNQLDLIEALEITRAGRVLVDRKMKTNIAGLYAAGDGADYEGKVPLLSVGFGEAVIAVNAITNTISLDHDIRKGHSSSLFADQKK
ncbi:NAD(P)/FAD-dependent oxidoreductase [Lactococcus fujiensis]|uniref:Ferredoxin--NADP reductase n=1 Tax=Lactococcus fujiensis JCM 16395 TaxID=1291764 RepID=A0A2A5RPN3_9LACT|nr:NAD(P)/FAD-dependent oxidoreductase [Lactococcus fujiensis]PCS01382.1 ferredoxin--NADP reductase [Lactococcus fujiensis JCM 16395]